MNANKNISEINKTKIMDAKEIETMWRKNYIFVYRKNDIIKCLDLVSSMKEDKKLIREGWKLTSAIDPIIYLENLHNVRKIDTEL